MAIANLQLMVELGELRIPEPWINDRGQVQVPWCEDADGDVLACYMDILGLNGRPIRTAIGWKAASRASAAAVDVA